VSSFNQAWPLSGCRRALIVLVLLLAAASFWSLNCAAAIEPELENSPTALTWHDPAQAQWLHKISMERQERHRHRVIIPRSALAVQTDPEPPRIGPDAVPAGALEKNLSCPIRCFVLLGSLASLLGLIKIWKANSGT
jgi:hypothetical protein